MKRNLTLLAASIIVLITASSITAAVSVYRQNLEIRSLEHLKSQHESDLHKTEGELKNTKDQKQQIEQKAKEQEQQIQDLNNQLQAKRAAKESLAAATLRNATFTGRASAAVVAGCGDNFYANYIYSHESGCDLNAVNPGGCRGIGQACPGSKLPCGADYACQNAWFTDYAMAVYGSWEGAYNFWLSHHYW